MTRIRTPETIGEARENVSALAAATDEPPVMVYDAIISLAQALVALEARFEEREGEYEGD